jgi:hypothetical protein
VLANENLSPMEWGGQDHHLRQTLLQGCDMVFGSNPKTVQWCLGKDPYREGTDAFISEFKSLKPCIHGSDAHDLDRIGRPCAKRGVASHTCGAGSDCEMRHCWIKADPTFEGLRQVVYEPESRVRIQADDPSPLRSGHSLTRLAVPETRINADLTMAPIDLLFNHGMVAVAGGKGSGKTALLDLIAHSFSDRRFVDDKNSFVKRIAGDAPSMDVVLTFADGRDFKKRVLDAVVCQGREITYIAQGELEDRIGDKDKLGAHIRELVLGSPQVKDGVRTFDLREAEARTVAGKRAVSAIQDRIHALEDTTSSAIESEIQRDEEALRTGLADTQSKIDLLARKVGEERAAKAKATQNKLNGLEGARDKLIALRGSLDSVETFATTALPEAISVVEAINVTLKGLGVTQLLILPTAYPTSEITTARAEVEERLRQALQSIEDASKDLGALEEDIREHAGYLRAKAETEAKLEALDQQRAELATQREQLLDLRNQRRTLYRRMLQDTLTQRDIYRDLFNTFSANKKQVLSEVVFTPEVFYERPDLEEAVTSVVDGRKVPYVADELNLMHEAIVPLAKGDSTDVDAVIAAIESLAPSLAARMKGTRALDRATLYRVLWDNYLSVRPSIRYKGAPLDRLSLGQKATVLVKVYLAQGTTPIIIDSHDEHMDNQFIMDELVSALREAKEYRQVIVASNNGNVVVNSDAEQVVLASFSGGRISYTSGSLEDPTVREAALRVLEGGAEAFKRRRAKYRVIG